MTLMEMAQDRIVTLDNRDCPYCGLEFDGRSVIATEDHVIGLKFVPKGSLAKLWNLHVNCCSNRSGNTCNQKKGDLEAEVAALTMQPDVMGKHAHPNPLLAAEAQRKGTQRSSKTGKSVKDSAEHVKLEAELIPGLKFTGDFHAPPQLSDDLAFNLAAYHVRAFYYWCTYDKNLRRGTLCPDILQCLHVRHSDWGHPFMVGFMKETLTWETRLLRAGSDLFFKAALRRRPDSDVWSWALEWNHNHRLVGFVGPEADMKAVAEALPKRGVYPGEKMMVNGKEGFVQPVTEVALPETEDILFARNPEETATPAVARRTGSKQR